MHLQLTWWMSAHGKERALLHVCSFSQYIYRAAALDLMVASNLSRVVVVPLRKSVPRTRSNSAA